MNTLPDVIIIDSIGILAEVYAAADFAYVGGGLHNKILPEEAGNCSSLGGAFYDD